jgi:hypothetical protein
MNVPRWVWLIGGLVLAMFIVAFVLERMYPESGQIEDIGRAEIARATGHTVSAIACERRLHITRDVELPCSVTLDNGTKFDTIAGVDAHYSHQGHYTFTATFFPVPGQRRPIPVPSHTPYLHSPADAQRLGDCVTAAGTDPAKIQACTAGM